MEVKSHYKGRQKEGSSPCQSFFKSFSFSTIPLLISVPLLIFNVKMTQVLFFCLEICVVSDTHTHTHTHSLLSLVLGGLQGFLQGCVVISVLRSPLTHTDLTHTHTSIYTHTLSLTHTRFVL